MGAPRVFIDGHAGTTGLRIREWLAGRDDLELLVLDETRRKDADARRAMLREADLAVLCLPDATAREAATWVEGAGTRLIDPSTAHRVADGWLYGLPELEPGWRERIAAAERVSNPGCYAVAVVLALRPLVDAALLPADAPLAVHAVSGYSGGGRELIERWEDRDGGLLGLPFQAPYALDGVHKHLPEMAAHGRLARPPHFLPTVGPFRTGMRVAIPLPATLLAGGASGKAVWEALDARYAGERFVDVAPLREPLEAGERSFDPRALNGTNRVELAVIPNPLGHVLVLARLDNLGKGAAGSAIQNLNLMLGLPEDRGLTG